MNQKKKIERVLIVDDEAVVRSGISRALHNRNIATETAANGEEALLLLKDHAFDLVLLDIKMEDIDGLEVLENIRAKTGKMPVILNSAYNTYKNNFTSWLADAYLVKSSDLSELKNKVRELLTV